MEADLADIEDEWVVGDLRGKNAKGKKFVNEEGEGGQRIDVGMDS